MNWLQRLTPVQFELSRVYDRSIAAMQGGRRRRLLPKAFFQKIGRASLLRLNSELEISGARTNAGIICFLDLQFESAFLGSNKVDHNIPTKIPTNIPTIE